MNIVCLVPARNAERYLPTCIAHLEAFVDSVVALDDGSTDDTFEILTQASIVKAIIKNPIRETYQGWDDSLNRNRLLARAEALRPDWIISLDADEFIAGEEARKLRDFLDRDASKEFAYGFRVCRLIADLNHFDKTLWVYRLFGFRSGLRFSHRRLHFVPIPTSITRERWFRTHLSIKHLASLSTEDRQRRYQKYREADPERQFQSSYENLLEEPSAIKEWVAFNGEQILLEPGHHLTAKHVLKDLREYHVVSEFVLSVVIIARNDEARIAACIAAVLAQVTTFSFEVIVVCSGSDATAAIVRTNFPQVQLVELLSPVSPGRARNEGWRRARGEYVSFPGSHVTVLPGSLQARIEAHELGYVMVTNPIINGNESAAGWASYFMDHSSSLPGKASTELHHAPLHCSYRRDALGFVNGFPEWLRAGEDTYVNKRLFSLGFISYYEKDALLRHWSPCNHWLRLFQHHFIRGLNFGILLGLQELSPTEQCKTKRWQRLRTVGYLALLYPGRRFKKIFVDINNIAPEYLPRFRSVGLLIRLAIFSATVGALFGCFRAYLGLPKKTQANLPGAQ